MEKPLYYKEYYLTLLGYHTSQMITHLSHIRNPNSDLVDMLLHHFVTVALIVFSYTLNYIGPGVIIIFLHDIADFPGMVTKTFSETEYKMVTLPAFLITIVVWFYTRLLYFPYIIYLTYTLHEENGFFCLNVMVFFLSVLVVLHAFWFYMFI